MGTFIYFSKKETDAWLKDLKGASERDLLTRLNQFVMTVSTHDEECEFEDKHFNERLLTVFCPTEKKARELYEGLLLDIAERRPGMKVVSEGHSFGILAVVREYMKKFDHPVFGSYNMEAERDYFRGLDR